MHIEIYIFFPLNYDFLLALMLHKEMLTKCNLLEITPQTVIFAAVKKMFAVFLWYFLIFFFMCLLSFFPQALAILRKL